MSGLKKHYPDIAFSGNKISPDEIDMYRQYTIYCPASGSAWVGACAGGTSTQAKAMTLTNSNLDYPRNLLYGIVGTSDMGGTWVVNGKDQFGATVVETVDIGTAANGGTTNGTAIFAQVTSGTCTLTTGSKGSGTAHLGVAVGTSHFGLPDKISAYTDVKSITWVKNFVNTTFGGGTIVTGMVDTTYHAIIGTATSLGTCEAYVVLYKPTKNLIDTPNQANW